MGRVFFNTRKNTQSLTGAYQMLASDSGTTFFSNQAAGYIVLLPSISAGDALDGWNCRIVIETNVTSGNFQITEGAGDANVLVVQTNEQQNNAVPAALSAGCTNVLLASGVDVEGDSFDIVCSGSKMYINANVAADVAVTVT
tara:strand:- start:493 stop:918 length:426 start_codon:yes stop_codon:yes gene_type:complete